MSYDEYNDLYLKAQYNEFAPYRCISFDLVNSKRYDCETSYEQHILMRKTLNDVVCKIQDIEHRESVKILVSDERIKLACKDNTSSNYAYEVNPCIVAGDFFAFYIYNKLISERDFLDIFIECAKSNKIYFAYHYQSAKFETTDYTLGNTKYYLGYCVGYLEHNKGSKIISIKDDMQSDKSNGYNEC